MDHLVEEVTQEAPPKSERVKGQVYRVRGEYRRWAGRCWHCRHNKPPNHCRLCGGASVCEHDKLRNRCKECGGVSICEHGRERYHCKECGGPSFCEHGRQRHQCKECGGSSFCEHDRKRAQCKECGGSSICEHGRQRSHCKECNGSSICDHGRERYYCKECGGAGICEHDRQRNICKECGGISVCIHARLRQYCKECGGASICEHGCTRYYCKECGGRGICDHGRYRSHCKECGGGSICEHGRERYICKECGGTGICAHDRQKSHCKECDGSAICDHGRARQYCKDCLSAEQLAKRPRVCKMCLNKWIGAERAASSGICAECDPSKPPMMQSLLQPLLPMPSYRDDKLIGGLVCSTERTRPDLCWVLSDRVVHVEIDEHSHEHYDPSCENRKLDSANWGFLDSGVARPHLPSVFVRFNPHEYDGRRVTLEKRCKLLAEEVIHSFAVDLKTWDPLRANVVFMFYHSNGAKHINAAKMAEASVNLLKVIE